jgi:hypothetical protein
VSANTAALEMVNRVKVNTSMQQYAGTQYYPSVNGAHEIVFVVANG